MSSTTGTIQEDPAAARARRRNDPAWQQIRTERALAAPFMGNFEFRIVWELAWGVAGWALVGTAGVVGWLPYWLTVPLSAVFAALLYMPMHEATHRNIQGRHRNLGWLNDAVGHIASVPLIFGFRAHQPSHMKHHAFTNDEEKDPDLTYKGSFGAVALRTSLLFTVGYLFLYASWIPVYGQRLLDFLDPSASSERAARDREEFLADRGFQTLMLLVMIGIAVAGYPIEVLMFWLIPARLAAVLVVFIFAWLPHHPHNGRGRYTNTRATLFPGSNLLARGHDRHIIHHMIPRVPHYRIGEVFDRLRPVLEERGTRIEGPGAGAGAPPVYLGSDETVIAEIAKRAAMADRQPFA